MARWRWRRMLPLALGITLLGLAGLLAYARLTDQDLGAAAERVDWRLVPLAASFHVVAHVLWGLRVSLLSGPSGVHLRPLHGWRLITAGTFGGAITPGRIGGEALKLTMLVREGASAAAASRLLLMDRIADLVFFVATGLAAIVVLPLVFASGRTTQGLAMAGAGLLILFLVLLIVLLRMPRAAASVAQGIANVSRLWGRRPQVRERAVAFVQEVRTGLASAVRQHPGRSAFAMVLTLGNWVAEYTVLWILLHAFGHDVPYVAVFLAGTVVTLVANIPLTPGGTAIAEVSAYTLLLPLAPGLTVLLPVVWRSVTYLYDIVVGGTTAAIVVPGIMRRSARDAHEA